MAFIQRPNYLVNIYRDRESLQLIGRVRKTWWSPVSRSGATRVLAEVWQDTTGMSEADALAGMLHDLAAAVAGHLGEPGPAPVTGTPQTS